MGNTTTTTYTRNGDLRATTFADGSFLSGITDPGGTFVNVASPLGTTHFGVDRAGNIIREVDAVASESLFTYDANGNLLTETSFRHVEGVRRSLITSHSYDLENRRILTRDSLGNVIRTEYDSLGNPSTRIDALGRRTTFEYDGNGQLIRTDYPDGTAESIEYDAAGNKIRHVDQANRATLFEYDKLNRLIATIYPDDTPADPTDNPRRQSVYDRAGREVATIDENGHRTDYEFDDAGRRTRTIQPPVLDGVSDAIVQPVLQEEYDAVGQRVASVDANGNRTEYEFDPMGRSTVVRFADGTEIRHQYDAVGNLIATIDQAGQATRYEYDSVGRLIRVALPAPAPGLDALVTNYSYDEVGNRLTATDALSHTTTLAYDELNRLVRRERPGGQAETFAYDAVGNTLSHTDDNGATTHFAYDALNRLVRKDFPDLTSVVTTYTPTGQVATQTDSRGQTRYAYDERDRLLSRTEPDNRAISYSYDDAGNRLSVASPAATTRYTYDAVNRLVQVADSRGGLTAYEHDQSGNLVQTEYPNGAIESRAFDALNRTTSVVHRGPGGLIASFDYTFDLVGRRTSVVEHDGRWVDYGYDLAGRLISEAIVRPALPIQTIAYEYDAVGNRLSRTDSVGAQTSYEYDVNDRLLRETTGGEITTYTYDANGNTLSIAGPAEQRVFTWDAEHRLVGLTVTNASGTQTVEYEYNAAGLRVSRTMDGQETRYLIDELLGFGEVLEEYQSGGNTLAKYTYGVDLIAQERAEQTSFFHTDGQTSTRVLTDQNAGATDSYFYEAYGGIAERSGTTINARLYRGEEFDSSARAYYLRARYYDPASGRFHSTDPESGIADRPLSLYLSLFANSDPVNHSDPSGRTTIVELEVTQVLHDDLSAAEAGVMRTILNLTARATDKIRTSIIRNGIERIVVQGLSGRARKEVIQEAAREARRLLTPLSQQTRERIFNSLADLAQRLGGPADDLGRAILEVLEELAVTLI